MDLSLTWYPDYRAELSDGTALQTGVGDGGVLRVYLPEGESGTVMVTYREPWYILAGRCISLLSFLTLLGYVMQKKRRPSPLKTEVAER